jgi:hypothetical protein
VLGHFRGEEGAGHVDWMTSGSNFDAKQFGGLMDAIARGMLAQA